MKRGDFGAREVFFILVLMLLGIAISWACTLVFQDTITVISSFLNVIGFGVWLMFQ